MQLSAWALVFFVVIFVAHVDVVESRGGGGGGGRGSSGGRSSSSSSSKSGGRGSSSSYHGGSGGGISTFSTGTGVGSIARSRLFKTAIAGYLTYQAGKAIIRTAGAAMMWNNQSYYWGPSYYQNRSGYEMCSMSLINSTDNTFHDVFFNNGTRPKAILWGCQSYSEYCCGYECCTSDSDNVLEINFK
uniref:CX domain-containing protein n=1 Tax=Plectus sambesii TaxID=2011161 RepID=A0A914XH17_9BILA